MADLELHNPGFDIEVSLDQGTQKISVQPDETSDGVEYFNCKSGAEQLTQIRPGEGGAWDQLWGQLSQQDVDKIGEVITKYQLTK